MHRSTLLAEDGSIEINKLTNASLSFDDLFTPEVFKGTIQNAHAENIRWLSTDAVRYAVVAGRRKAVSIARNPTDGRSDSSSRSRRS